MNKLKKEDLKKNFQKAVLKCDRLMNYLKISLSEHKRDSVFFYTFHKTASTLFSGYVLKHVDGLHHVDYASQIYEGKLKGGVVRFEEKGRIYGPIRLSANTDSAVYAKLVSPAQDAAFARNKKAVIFIRDPRDIIISKYFSLAFSHNFSPVEEIRRRQMKIREITKNMSVDEFARKDVHQLLAGFQKAVLLSQNCASSYVLKYEDMISNWEAFEKSLAAALPLRKSVLNSIYSRTRPSKTENIYSHRRSGAVRGFENKLSPETLDFLNIQLKPVLDYFNYTI